MSGIIAEFNEGGPFMYLILSISVFALSLILYKTYLLYIKYRIPEDDITESILKQVQTSNYARAIQFCSSKNHPLLHIVKAGLMRASKPEKEIRRAIEVVATKEIPAFKRGVSFLPHLSNVSTMLGLLGTIRGLIIAFSGMEGGDVIKRQEALSTGIAIAFRATFFALSVAAVLVFCFVLLNNRQNRMVEKMEHIVTTVVDALVTRNLAALKSQKAP